MDFKSINTFLKKLSKNNNRDWFEKNKGEYLEAKEQFEEFVTALLATMAKFDSRLLGLNPKKLAFRIYRDVRFSKDKRPYKTNMGATFSPGGKLMNKPGYYLHIEPGNKSFVAGGLYMPATEDVAKVRQEIDYNGKKLEAIFKNPDFKKYYKGFDVFDQLKKAPKGYAPDHKYIEWLKMKSFIVTHYFKDTDVLGKNFLKDTTVAFKAMKSFNDFLDEAIA
jgi:uncharacterized protein (TIGR02453 family)